MKTVRNYHLSTSSVSVITSCEWIKAHGFCVTCYLFDVSLTFVCGPVVSFYCPDPPYNHRRLILLTLTCKKPQNLTKQWKGFFPTAFISRKLFSGVSQLFSLIHQIQSQSHTSKTMNPKHVFTSHKLCKANFTFQTEICMITSATSNTFIKWQHTHTHTHTHVHSAHTLTSPRSHLAEMRGMRPEHHDLRWRTGNHAMWPRPHLHAFSP